VRSLLPGWLPLALRLSSLGSSATQQAKLRRRQSTAYSCTDYHGAAPGTEAQRLLAQPVTQETSPAIAALAATGWRLGKASVIMPSCRKTLDRLEGMAAKRLLDALGTARQAVISAQTQVKAAGPVYHGCQMVSSAIDALAHLITGSPATSMRRAPRRAELDTRPAGR